jgi:excinuclease UvrABC ATPase subunit
MASLQTNLELRHAIEDLKRNSNCPEFTFNLREHKQQHVTVIQKLQNELAAERALNEQMDVRMEKVRIPDEMRAEIDHAADQIARKGDDSGRRIDELEQHNRNQSNLVDQFTRERDEAARELGQKGPQWKLASLSIEESQSKEC